jgi:isochorismate synthase / 2-succinyl-5-enolpyruvyl-6-hydroxy-3-cyclohexene-1-carboxylate synthase / 2-succinyl-6-hydroxy-2,4-cyclohexadiene-1-carboxylate synthase / o-succinylbenzoate synthase
MYLKLNIILKSLSTGHMQNNIVIFLHGFLGTSEDWAPIMKSLSKDAHMISVDLPGHGKSQVQTKQEFSLSVETISRLLLKLVDEISTEGQGVIVVGYSMGARIALHMTLNSEKVSELKKRVSYIGLI